MNTARSAAFIVLSQVAKVVLSLVALSTLSRILSPGEFGLFAMIAAVLGIGDLFRDFGLSMAAIQARDLDQHQRTNLFWLNVLVGGTLTAVAVAAAPAVSALYDRPELTGAVAVVALTFLLSSAAAQFRVGLIRANRFPALTVTDVTSQTVALCVAITCALAGAGFWSLAAQAVVQSALALVLAASQLRWLPGLPNRKGNVRSMIGFGANLLGVQVLTYAGKNLDTILLGRVWGPVALGFYSKAFTLYSQPQTQALAPFTDLAVNTLSRSLDDPEAYRRRLHTMQLIANYVALCLFGALIALAEPAVRLLLGPGWSQTALLLQILSIGGLFQMLGNVYYWVFLTQNRTGVHLRCTLISQPVAIGCILAGLPFGPVGVAWGASAGLFVEWFVPAVWGVRRTSVDGAALLRSIPRPLLFAAGLTIVMRIAVLTAPAEGAVAVLGIGSAAGVIWIAACFLLWPKVRADIRDIVRIGRSGFSARRSRASAPVAAGVGR